MNSIPMCGYCSPEFVGCNVTRCHGFSARGILQVDCKNVLGARVPSGSDPAQPGSHAAWFCNRQGKGKRHAEDP